jgi:hypothetical protein
MSDGTRESGPPGAPTDPTDPTIADEPPQPAPFVPVAVHPRVWVESDVVVRTSTPRPVLGPALVASGWMLWAFVVLGTYTTSWIAGGGAPLSQGVALALFAAVSLAACRFAERRGRPLPIVGARGPVARFVVVGIVAWSLWLAALVVATVVGKTSRVNLDALMAACLLGVGGLAVLRGDRMLGGTRLPRSGARRTLVLAAWLAVGIVTLGALVELVAEY